MNSGWLVRSDVDVDDLVVDRAGLPRQRDTDLAFRLGTVPLRQLPNWRQLLRGIAHVAFGALQLTNRNCSAVHLHEHPLGSFAHPDRVHDVVLSRAAALLQVGDRIAPHGVGPTLDQRPVHLMAVLFEHLGRGRAEAQLRRQGRQRAIETGARHPRREPQPLTYR